MTADFASADRPPLVSIGLPVFNGERYVGQTIAALLDQTMTDFELIISDNASTDRTVPICLAVAAGDRRVRLRRQPTNIGAVANFNAVLAAASGTLFKWAADDDLHDRTFLDRCVAALQASPDAAIAYSRARSIGADGRISRSGWGPSSCFGSEDPAERFRAGLAPPVDPVPLPLFGVARTSTLRSIGPMAPGPDFDRAFLAELSLHGPFVEVAEPLFSQRDHPGRIGPALAADSRGAAERLGRGRLLPHWHLARRHLAGIARRPDGVAQRPLLAVFSHWLWRSRGLLAGDLLHAIGTLPAVGPAVAAAVARVNTLAWERRCRAFYDQLERVLPAGAEVVLVDDSTMAWQTIGERRCTTLWDPDQGAWGFASHGDDAVNDLTARRRQGATHLVIAWPALWTLDYHPSFKHHLEDKYDLLLRNEYGMVYELTPGP